MSIEYCNEFIQEEKCIYSKLITNFHKGLTVQNLLIVEKNAVKIWKINSSPNGGKSELEEIYNLVVHKDIKSGVHLNEEILILVEGNLLIKLDETVRKTLKIESVNIKQKMT